MKRWKSSFFFLILYMTMLIGAVPTYAHPTAKEHNKELEQVLLEPGYPEHKNDEVAEYIEALELASQLTIDQFQDNNESQFIKLKKMGMLGLTMRFQDIEYLYDLDNSSQKVSATTHRKYTHEGWDRDYTTKGREKQKFWYGRKKILLNTVNSIFGFDKITLFGYGEMTNCLAGIIYYVHILGDYIEADKYTKISLLPDIAGRINANDTDKDYDMITSLKKYCETLFYDQKDTLEYKNLIKEMDDIAAGAGKIVRSTGGVNTEEEFKEYHQYAQNLLNVLIEHIPNLLKNEEFFAKKFYN